MTDLEQIKAKLSLEVVVGETVVLKPSGRDQLKGLCPFHGEKTPSFVVYTDRGRFHCYGSCKQSGDIFDFVQQSQGVTFQEAKVMLAARAGVTLENTQNTPARKPTKDLADLQALAQGYFLTGLAENSNALTYLLSRGLTEETIAAWGLGYAPDAWHGLIALARNQNVQPEALERAGLAKIKDGRPFDMFRARVTIPIYDTFGRIVGFSARAMGDAQPKYLNTPETDLFKKGSILFGLHRARHTIREKRAAIMVEGQLDVIMLHQAGFTAAVGGQSSTLTPAQITLFDRLGLTTLYMAFDADEAGQKATLSGLDAVARQFLVKVVKLPGGDPAEVVKDDPAAFRDALKRAVPETRFRLSRALDGLDMSKPADKQTALERLKEGMRDVREPFDPVAEELRRLVAECFGMDEAKLQRWANGGPHTRVPMLATSRATVEEPLEALKLDLMALALAETAPQREAVLRFQALAGDDPSVAEFCGYCVAEEYDLGRVLDRCRDWASYGSLVRRCSPSPTYSERLFTRLLEKYSRITGKPPAPHLSALHAYLESFPDDFSATDKRTSALADYVGCLPEAEQGSIFDRLADNLLSGLPTTKAPAAELLVDALALHLSTNLAGDPVRHLETARAALLAYRPSTPQPHQARA